MCIRDRAYIGGLIEDDPKHNLPKVRKWLSKLARPVIEEEFRKDDDLELNEVDINAKKTLYSLIGYAALNLHYKPVQKPSSGDSNALVECRIKDGTVLGVGRGRNIKIAGMRAAQQVLLNKPLIEKYANLRAAVPRSDSVVKRVGSKRTSANEDSDNLPQRQQTKKPNFGLESAKTQGSAPQIIANQNGSLDFKLD